MSSQITAATRLVALLGDPVAHSLSPTFQNAALDAAGIDAVYVALRVSAEELPSLLLALARSGGAGNVTVPYKEIAAATVERPTEAVVRTGACNTFWLEEGSVHGDNTDVAGFLKAAESALAGADLAKTRVLLLGAGGAARGAAWALLEAGADEIVIANRSPGRAEDLKMRLAPDSSRLRVHSQDWLRGEHFDFAVNSTALGLSPGDPLPLPFEGGPTFSAALDMVYSPDRTPWVRGLRERGIPAEDGLEMLLYQGAAAFERWWGFAPSIVAMRSALPSR